MSLWLIKIQINFFLFLHTHKTQIKNENVVPLSTTMNQVSFGKCLMNAERKGKERERGGEKCKKEKNERQKEV